MTTMYSPSEYRKLKAERDELLKALRDLVFAAEHSEDFTKGSGFVAKLEAQNALIRAEART
jgi:hypothetical protein